jgi:glyoxylase-like metal-dependent hydrolase (beta-lactamase superfamily II)
MDIRAFPVTPFIENCYVVRDENESLIIDPGDSSSAILRHIAGTTVKMIVNTHGHCDHCGGNAALVASTGADLAIHADDLPLLRAIEMQGRMFGIDTPASPEPTRILKEGDVIKVGNASFRVIHVPGHSPGHIALVGDGVVFSGDVLFAGSIGRTDLFGGDYHQIITSIRDKMLALPDDMTVYPGHGPSTTIGDERQSNPFLCDL